MNNSHGNQNRKSQERKQRSLIGALISSFEFITSPRVVNLAQVCTGIAAVASLFFAIHSWNIGNTLSNELNKPSFYIERKSAHEYRVFNVGQLPAINVVATLEVWGFYKNDGGIRSLYSRQHKECPVLGKSDSVLLQTGKSDFNEAEWADFDIYFIIKVATTSDNLQKVLKIYREPYKSTEVQEYLTFSDLPEKHRLQFMQVIGI